MFIGGNFRQVTTSSANNFSASGNHKVVFNGTELQTIQFDSSNSGFNNVQFVNPNIELKGKYLRGFTLNEDISLILSTDELNLKAMMDLNGHSLGIDTIAGDFTLTNWSSGLLKLSSPWTVDGSLQTSVSINLNGYDLTVNGDMISTGNVDLQGGTLTVTGTLYQQSGDMFIDGGKLNIGESYYIAGADSVFTEGREVYKSCSGRIIMKNANDEIHIGQNFATASSNDSYYNKYEDGVMFIGGNFRQVTTSSANNFSASGNHKVVLNGTGIQTVQFDSTSSHFATLELKQPINMYVFNPNPCWDTLIEFALVPDFVLPASLTSIESEAFIGGAFTYVKLPDNAVSIGYQAFADCPNLAYIYIPASTTLIDDEAFGNMQGLTIIGKTGTAAETYAQNHNYSFMAVP